MTQLSTSFDEIFRRDVPAGVTLLKQVPVAAVGLFIGEGFVLPFRVLLLQGVVLLQHPLCLVGNRVVLVVGHVLFEPVVEDHEALRVAGEADGVLGRERRADDGAAVDVHHRSREGDEVREAECAVVHDPSYIAQLSWTLCG